MTVGNVLQVGFGLLGMGTEGTAFAKGLNTVTKELSATGRVVEAVEAEVAGVGGRSSSSLPIVEGEYWQPTQKFAQELESQGMGVVCFAPETPLLTPSGDKPISQFKPGDQILSAPESDPSAPPAVQFVEEVFKNRHVVLNLHVGGRVIRTTASHPFYVRGRGWRPAGELEPGHLLRSHDGLWTAVEGVFDNREESIVYNLRVSEYHTYFVGSGVWGFSVWAHNVGCGEVPIPGQNPGRILTAGEMNGLTREFMEGVMQEADYGFKAFKNEWGPALSIAQDTVTGQLSHIHWNNPFGHMPADLSDVIASRLATAPELIATRRARFSRGSLRCK